MSSASDPKDFWIQVPVARSFAVSCDQCRFNDPRAYTFAPTKRQQHEGLDFAATNNSGQPVAVLAAQRGVVDRVGFVPEGYGNYVRIVHNWHDGTYVTWYGHLSQVLVQEGQFVNAGAQIGIAGNTGFSSGIHLHLTLQHLGHGLDNYVVDDVVNPEPFLCFGTPPAMNEAAWVEDVTVPDGTLMQEGQQFVKTWRIRNTGNTTWGNDFKLVFVEGERMDGPDHISLPHAAPGQVVELSLTLVAPRQAGRYRSVWQPQDAEGKRFNYQIYTEIEVIGVAERDEATYVADVTIADGALVQPGQTFLKTWRLRNTGTTTWGNGYRLTFFNHDRMGAPQSVPLPPAKPGEEVDVSVTLRAPGAPGIHRSTWKPRSPHGEFFEYEQYAEIMVPRQAPPTERVDEARYVADVTVEDGTLVQPSQPFTKTWRIRNSGTTTWGPGYVLAFFGDNQMGGPASVPLPQVAPGETVDVSVNLTAPTTPGVHRSTWKPRNANGQFFEFDLYVEIQVAQPIPPSQKLDEARFVEDVTVPDGTVMQPGQTFIKTWRLRNTGTTTWGPKYSLAFLKGERMDGPQNVLLPTAEPGQTVDISVSLKAPTTPGVHRSTWKPRNAAGQSFEFEMYAEIEVVAPPAPGKEDAVTFVEHVGVPAEASLHPGETFVKTWRVRNTGRSRWGPGYTIAFTSGDRMNGPESVPLAEITPQRSHNVSVTLRAPATPGQHRAVWRARDPHGELFGDELPVVVNVKTEGDAVDLQPYMRGDGRIYVLRYTWGGGGQQQVQTQHDGNRFYHVKGHEWEELWADDNFIYRGTDTSPGDGNYYTLTENGSYGSPWLPRCLVPGVFFRRQPTVTFYRKADCRPINSFSHTTWIRLEKVHPELRLNSGITLPDVVELAAFTEPGGRRADTPFEHYFYARNYGLVAWRGAGIGESFLIEELAPGTQGIQREVIPCR